MRPDSFSFIIYSLFVLMMANITSLNKSSRLLRVKASIRKICALTSSITYDYSLQESITQKPKNLNMLEINAQLKDLVKTGQLHNARKLFDEMPRRDEVTWTTIISGYVGAVEVNIALSLFSKMWIEPGVNMDPFVLSVALKACGLGLNLKFGETLFGYSIKTDFFSSVFVGSALVDMYAKVGKIKESCRVFNEMSVKNVVTWTAIITGLVRAGLYKKGLVYFSEMWKLKVICDSYTFAIALKACADSGLLNYGREIHCQATKKGLTDSSYVANTLTTMYNKCGKLDYGLSLFEKLSVKDVISWTSIITTYIQTGQEKNAVEAFLRMRETGVVPNEYTFAALISGCATLGKIEWGKQSHAHVLCLGLADSSSVANSIISMYSKCGQMNLASRIFQGLARRDIVAWSTIIAGYSQDGCAEEAFECLGRMRREGVRPTEFALSSVLSVCGSMALLEQGKQFHGYVLHLGLDHTSMTRSSLINMYAKCGSIKDASKIFGEAEYEDAVSWTAMINGFAEHGYSKEAISLFEKISKVGLRPDAVTFIGVLTACSHAGQVELGFRYFNLMSEKYKIHPSKQHYGCMIDLLCRAGRLQEAESMIQTMPFQQDEVVWSTLLRACRISGDVERGQRAAQKILDLDPNCAGTHITLANTYAAQGKYKEAASLRKMMRIKGVIKEPGWSWIKIKDQISAFVSRDRTHSQSEEIYSILDLLASRTELSIQEINSLFDTAYS